MPSSVQITQCSCSPAGLVHPLWSESYYPPECPEEWRITYFCNDFRAMYLPSETWYQQPYFIKLLTQELFAEIFFDLVLEWPYGLLTREANEVLAQLQSLKAHIRSFVIMPEAGKGVDQKLVLTFEQIRTYKERGFEKFDHQNQVGLIDWRDQEFKLSHAGYYILNVPCLTLREFKPILMQLKEQLKLQMRVGIFIEPSSLSAQRAIEVRTMLELMNLA